MPPTLDHPNRRPSADPEAQAAFAQRVAAEQINDLTLSLLNRMMTMTQAVIDAANRIAASSQAAGALISQLVSANGDLTSRNADLTAKLAEAQANTGNAEEDLAAADRLNGAADSLDAAVASAQSAQGGAPVDQQSTDPVFTGGEPVVEPTPEAEPGV